MKRSAALLLPVFSLLALSACSSVDGDVALEQQLDNDDRNDFVDGVVEGAQGVILRDEAQCWSDAVIATGATPDDLDLWAADPLSISGPDYLSLLTDCVDPSTEADVPIEGLIRTSFLAGLTQDGLLTNAQAECVLNGLDGAGFNGRDLFLSGVSEEAALELGEAFDQLAGECI